jgi:hypothetical protein
MVSPQSRTSQNKSFRLAREHHGPFWEILIGHDKYPFFRVVVCGGQETGITVFVTVAVVAAAAAAAATTVANHCVVGSYRDWIQETIYPSTPY